MCICNCTCNGNYNYNDKCQTEARDICNSQLNMLYIQVGTLQFDSVLMLPRNSVISQNDNNEAVEFNCCLKAIY